jgi:NADH:ubiquinone oxidoreductase subunit C
MDPATMNSSEIDEYLAQRLGADAILATLDEYDTHTVTVTRESYVAAVTLLRDDKHLAFNMFDSSFGIDEREEGFSVVTILYSTTKRTRILIKVFTEGGRENPTMPSISGVFEGANWMERETWDMFGIEFVGHPQLAPRILTVENFEGWPLRKDFHLASRVAKPWPGVNEPAEKDEDGNVIVKVPRIGDAPGPTSLDEIMAEQARRVNAVELPEGEAAQDAAPAPAKAEAEIDQGTYDALIAEGKSERIARSKAKAAFIKMQRAAEAAAAPAAAPSAAPAAAPEPEPEPAPAAAPEPAPQPETAPDGDEIGDDQ